MIKTIIPGIIPKATTYQATCKVCGCGFTYQDEDVKSIDVIEQNKTIEKGAEYVPCPTCKRHVVHCPAIRAVVPGESNEYPRIDVVSTMKLI